MDVITEPAPTDDDVRRAESRRRRRRSAVAAAAATVLAVSAATAVLGGRDGASPPVANEPTEASLGPGWRTESWGGLSVDVPADWGYGGAPISIGGGDSGVCPPRFTTGGEVSGWVGRPVLLSDVCALYPWIDRDPQLEDPTPYVWLGGHLEVGVVTYPSGIVQETVELEGERLTVASPDAGLRQRILGSARPVEECVATTDAIPPGSSGMSVEGRGEPIDATVCAYRREAGRFELTYARTTTPDVVDRTWRAQAQAPAVESGSSCGHDRLEYVVVQARYDDPFGDQPLVQRATIRLGCTGEVDLGRGAKGAPVRTRLVSEGVEPWADAGISAVVHAPTDDQSLVRWLIGMQG